MQSSGRKEHSFRIAIVIEIPPKRQKYKFSIYYISRTFTLRPLMQHAVLIWLKTSIDVSVAPDFHRPTNLGL